MKSLVESFNVNCGAKFRVMTIVCLCMHTIFLITFAIMGLYFEAAFNIISVLTYITLTIISAKTDMTRHGQAWVCIIFSEILLHALLCTFFQGLDTNFYLYIISAFPEIAYMLFLLCDKKTFGKMTVVFGAISVVMILACIIFCKNFGSIIEAMGFRKLLDYEVRFLRNMNIFCNLGMILGFTVLFYFEVTSLLDKLRETNERLNFTATHDALTGLSNRYSLWEYFKTPQNADGEYCVVMGDLDDFKKINDTYGHDCGDRVLKSVACILTNSVKPGEIACRWGGEEMLLVLRGSKEECFPRVTKIREQITALNIKQDDTPVKVSMTFGLVESVEIPAESTQKSAVDLLISIADERLYEGKRSGKNTVIAA